MTHQSVSEGFCPGCYRDRIQQLVRQHPDMAKDLREKAEEHLRRHLHNPCPAHKEEE